MAVVTGPTVERTFGTGISGYYGTGSYDATYDFTSLTYGQHFAGDEYENSYPSFPSGGAIGPTMGHLRARTRTSTHTSFDWPRAEGISSHNVQPTGSIYGGLGGVRPLGASIPAVPPLSFTRDLGDVSGYQGTVRVNAIAYPTDTSDPLNPNHGSSIPWFGWLWDGFVFDGTHMYPHDSLVNVQFFGVSMSLTSYMNATVDWFSFNYPPGGAPAIGDPELLSVWVSVDCQPTSPPMSEGEVAVMVRMAAANNGTVGYMSDYDELGELIGYVKPSVARTWLEVPPTLVADVLAAEAGNPIARRLRINLDPSEYHKGLPTTWPHETEVLRAKPAIKMQVKMPDYTVADTGLCLQNAERSTCIQFKHPDGTWADLTLVGS